VRFFLLSQSFISFIQNCVPSTPIVCSVVEKVCKSRAVWSTRTSTILSSAFRSLASPNDLGSRLTTTCISLPYRQK